MKKIISVTLATLFILPLLAHANCPTIDKIYCSRTFGGLSCGADYPGWVGGGLTKRPDTTVKKFWMVTWFNTSIGKGSVRCLYWGDKGGLIVMHEGDFGQISVPTKANDHRLWKSSFQVINNVHYNTLACAAGLNACEFKYLVKY